jgi:hypothetical protein
MQQADSAATASCSTPTAAALCADAQIASPGPTGGTRTNTEMTTPKNFENFPQGSAQKCDRCLVWQSLRLPKRSNSSDSPVCLQEAGGELSLQTKETASGGRKGDGMRREAEGRRGGCGSGGALEKDEWMGNVRPAKSAGLLLLLNALDREPPGRPISGRSHAEGGTT